MVVLALGLVASLAGPALAHGKGPPWPEMTAEQRTKMAEAHEKMAACLRSDRPVGDCHSEMMKSCQETMGAGHCPMGHHGRVKPGETQ
jgi:hypothetical protein